MPTDTFGDYVELATSYLSAAEHLATHRALLPKLQLYGQAMELALKAFIASKGKEPRPIHDLLKLRETAARLGLVTTPDEDTVIQRLHQVFYETDGGFKYATRYPSPVTGFVWSGDCKTQAAIDSVLAKIPT